MTRRVLVLSAPFGSGHLQAARAIAEACRREDSGCEAEVVNVTSPLMERVFAGYPSLIRRAPGAYRTLYAAPVSEHTRALVRYALSRAVRQAIDCFGPTAVIATHPFPGAAAAQLRRTVRLQASVAMVVTDYLPHPFWADRGADRFFVASDAAADRLQALGIDPDRISVTGIPVRQMCKPAPPPTASGIRRVLVMGGGLGLGPLMEAVRSLVVLPYQNMQVTVVCGTNAALVREMNDLFGADPRIAILGFTDQIPQLMARAHLMITKPGGVTCSEALAYSLPMLLLQPLPGQEEENATHLTRTGAATMVHEDWVGALAAELLFTHPEKLACMKELARLAGRPRAAQAIAQETLLSSGGAVSVALEPETGIPTNARRGQHGSIQAARFGH